MVVEDALTHARRAAECAKLAALAIDEELRKDLLQLRQGYLRVAERLGMPMHEAIAIKVESQRDPPNEK